MQFKVYSRKYRYVMAAYGRYLAPYYDRWACMEHRAAVINLETIADFIALQDSIGCALEMADSVLMICDAPVSFDYVTDRIK